MGSREVRRKAIETKIEDLSRRDFARYAALSAVAAAIVTKDAHADRDPNRLDIGGQCKNFLCALDCRPQGSADPIECDINKLLFGEFRFLLTHLIGNLQAGHSLRSLEPGLNNLLQYMNSKYPSTGANKPSLADLYINKENQSPYGSADNANWKGIYDECRNASNKLEKNLSLPFLYATDAERTKIKSLLTSKYGDKSYAELVGNIKYRRLFTQNFSRQFNMTDPTSRLSYMLIRNSFEDGLFTLKKANAQKVDYVATEKRGYEQLIGSPPDDDSAQLIPNDRCCYHDGTQWRDDRFSAGDYCQLEAGIPTSASDICP